MQRYNVQSETDLVEVGIGLRHAIAENPNATIEITYYPDAFNTHQMRRTKHPYITAFRVL